MQYLMFAGLAIAVAWRVGFARKERKEAGRVLTVIVIVFLLIWAVSS